MIIHPRRISLEWWMRTSCTFMIHGEGSCKTVSVRLLLLVKTRELRTWSAKVRDSKLTLCILKFGTMEERRLWLEHVGRTG